VNVEELKRSEISANHVAQQIAWDIERRLPFRRAMKKQLEHDPEPGIKGAKILAFRPPRRRRNRPPRSSRTGALPLQTLRADIDYGTATAMTTYGTIGVKVWIYRGEKIRPLEF
jgi:small subunit ribosomal protein S3